MERPEAETEPRFYDQVVLGEGEVHALRRAARGPRSPNSILRSSDLARPATRARFRYGSTAWLYGCIAYTAIAISCLQLKHVYVLASSLIGGISSDGSFPSH